MAWWNRSESRSIVNADGVAGSTLFSMVMGQSASDVVVTTENALGVPAVWAAVNFLSATLAGLPCHVYKRSKRGRERVSGSIATLLHDAPNDYCSSFEWRKGLFGDALTTGRGLSYIERNAAGTPINIWPLDPTKVTIKRDGFVKTYLYRGDMPVTYRADEIIDIPFMLKADGLTHRGPLTTGADAIGLAIAVTNYGSQFLANGGVPPFAVTGNFQSPRAMKTAADDLAEAVKRAAKDKRQALILPTGLTIQPIGVDPEKSQMVDVQRYCVEQIARLYNIPPTFLQDLTHGTYSNTEQQDLHFVKHTLKRWVEQFEQEVNLKLFGRKSNAQYVEMNMDGLLRGDFKTRMEGWGQAVQNGLVTPAEARETENWPFIEGSDRLFMQGATVPINETGVQGGMANA